MLQRPSKYGSLLDFVALVAVAIAMAHYFVSWWFG